MPNDLILVKNDLAESQQIFQKEKSRLQQLLANYSISVEHIGSTAIPQTIGKGIIDILLICADETAQSEIRNILIDNGYIQGELNKVPDGRLFFSNTPHQTQAGDIHLHLVVKDSNNLESLAFRDYLIQHPEEVAAYNQEKTKLAKAANNNRHEYAVHKADFIQSLMQKLSSEPSAPVQARKRAQTLIQAITDWAKAQTDILGVALVGSYARNEAKESSDIDLVIIANNPKTYMDNDAWVFQFGDANPNKITNEDWGALKAKRVFYDSGIEVEFGFTTKEWTKTNPPDEGTAKVMQDGNVVLVDKIWLFQDLLQSLNC